MPYQINGIGTTYLGRKNAEERQGICDQCNQEATLHNYETKHWFTIIFVPIIPLGRKQILDECSQCRRHYAFSVEDWEASKQNAVEESAQHLATNPDDPESMISMHATLMACHRNDEADDLEALMTTRFSDDVDVLMYLGSVLEEKGQETEANKNFQRALELAPDAPGPRRAVGVLLLQQDRLDDARELFSVLKPPSENYDPALWFLLGVAYQNQNRHEEALELFEMILVGTPDAKNEKDFCQAMIASEKALGRDKSSLPKTSWFRSRNFLLSAAVAVIIIAALLYNSHIANHRKVHVVNGLPIAIEVVIDEETTITVPPLSSTTEIELAEGTHQVQVSKPDDLAESFEFTIETGWLERFNKDPAFVLDPSRTAVILWEETPYGENPVPEGDFEFHIGDGFVYYHDVDYFFKPFPSILRDQKKYSLTKTRVSRYKDPLIQLLQSSAGAIDGEELLGFLERHLRAKPDNLPLLEHYSESAQILSRLDRLLSFLSTGLDARPVRLQWHRLYQSIAENTDKRDALVGQYDAYLRKEPNNSHFLYLRGRLEPTAEEAFEFYDQAIEQDKKSWFPWSGKAYTHYIMGNFKEAVRTYDRALDLNPNNERTILAKRQAQLALGQYLPVKDALLEKQKQEALNWTVHVELLKLYAASDDMQTARDAHESYLNELNKINSPQVDQLKTLSTATMDYLSKDFTAWRQHAQGSFLADHITFAAELELGNPQAATDFPGYNEEEIEAYSALEVSLAWRLIDREEESQKWLRTARDKLRESAPVDRTVANLLSRPADHPVTLAEARNILIEPNIKALVLVVLAENSPDKEAILDLAESLNFQRLFPYHLVQRGIDAARVK